MTRAAALVFIATAISFGTAGMSRLKEASPIKPLNAKMLDNLFYGMQSMISGNDDESMTCIYCSMVHCVGDITCTREDCFQTGICSEECIECSEEHCFKVVPSSLRDCIVSCTKLCGCG